MNKLKHKQAGKLAYTKIILVQWLS